MSMYALGTLPLIQSVSSVGARQVWYADDASADGHLTQLDSWWDKLEEKGPAFGYFVNSAKLWLIVKEDHLAKAEESFVVLVFTLCVLEAAIW